MTTTEKNCKKGRGRPPLDLSGRRFHDLTALRPVGKGKAGVFWECACACGKTTTIAAGRLTSGRVRSCGCLAGGLPTEGGRNSALALAVKQKRMTVAQAAKVLGISRQRVYVIVRDWNDPAYLARLARRASRLNKEAP